MEIKINIRKNIFISVGLIILIMPSVMAATQGHKPEEISSGHFTGNYYFDNLLRIYDTKLIVQPQYVYLRDYVDKQYLVDPDEFQWTKVAELNYDGGPGSQQSSRFVSLASNKPVLGFKMEGSSDDGGICIINVPKYFTAAITNRAWLNLFTLQGYWQGEAYNHGASSMQTTDFVFENMAAGKVSKEVDQYWDKYYHYDKPYGLRFIPPGKWLYYEGWYVDGGGSHYVRCTIYALYGKEVY